MSSPRKSRRPNRKRSPSSPTDRSFERSRPPPPDSVLGCFPTPIRRSAGLPQRRPVRDFAPGNRFPRGHRHRSGRKNSPRGIAPSPLAIAPFRHSPPTALSSHGPNPEKPLLWHERAPARWVSRIGTVTAEAVAAGFARGPRPSPLRPRPELSGRHTPGVSYSEMLMPSEDTPGPRSHPPRLPPLPRIDLPWWSDPPHRSGPACPVTPCFHLSPNVVPRPVAAPC